MKGGVYRMLTFQADTALCAGIHLPVCGGDGLRPLEVVQLRRSATGENIRLG